MTTTFKNILTVIALLGLAVASSACSQASMGNNPDDKVAYYHTDAYSNPAESFPLPAY